MNQSLENDPIATETQLDVVVRQYGLLPPTDWGPDCEEELLRMTQLWNDLVRIEAAYREQYQAMMADAPGLSAINEEIATLLETQKARVAERKALRAGKPKKFQTTELDQMIREVSLEIARKKEAAGQLAKAFRERLRDRLRLLEAKRRTEVKVARQGSGLWWGNYNSVVKAFERGRHAALRSGGEMQSKRHDGSGRFTNQIQGGRHISDLFDGGHSQVCLVPLPKEAWSHPSRGERRRLQRTFLTVTVFTRDGERRTVTWPMVMHREIPADCLVKEVVITRRRVGTSWRWQAVFTCTRPAPIVSPPPFQRSVAINVGWRRVPEGIRVATVLRKDSAKPEFILLPESMVGSFSLIDDIRSRRSKQTSEIVSWLKTLDWADAPGELKAHIEAIWRTPYVTAGQLASFSIAWRAHQGWYPSEFLRLESWRVEDKKLLLWEANQREKLICRRRDLYRKAAREIVKDASKLILNDLNIGKMRRLNLALGQSNPLPAAARRYRTIAAPSQLRYWIQIQARKAGVILVISKKAAAWICHACGVVNKAAQPEALEYRCAHCNAVWDKDVNACQTMLEDPL
jgi:hypothetical protein